MILAVLLAVIVAERPPVVTVAVTTDAELAGFVSLEARDRLDSVEDLRRFLRAKAGTLRLVDDPAKADVVIEILARGRVERTPAGAVVLPNGFGGFNIAPVPRVRTLVKARIVVGDYEEEIVASSNTIPWRNAARNLARDIEKWVKQNRTRILAARTSKVGR